MNFSKITIVATILLVFSIGYTFADPTETGGAPCFSDKDCGGGASQGGGTCVITVTNGISTGKCDYPEDRADIDCSYRRKDSRFAGGFQFFCFIGVGGVGNFILERIVVAVCQLLLMLAPLFAICGTCCMACGIIGKSEISIVAGGCISYIFIMLLSCATLAGFIWCLVDAGMILSGDVLDGNGYKTYPM